MAYTDTSGSSLGTSLVQTAYDQLVEAPLREQPLFRHLINVKKPAKLGQRGDAVAFQLYPEMAEATGELTETTDPTPVAIGNTSTVSVTLKERGNSSLTTRKLRLTSLADVDPIVADLIATNMAFSIDSLAQTELRGGTNVIREISGTRTIGGATASVTATDYFKSRDVRAGVAKLRGASAPSPFGGGPGGLYAGVMHPDVSVDLREETGDTGWRVPQAYGVSQEHIRLGTVGIYEGALWYENARCYTATDGAASAKVYRTYLVAAQAMCEAVAHEPGVVIGDITDRLKRFRPVGWYGLLGIGRYREECLFRIETSATLA